MTKQAHRSGGANRLGLCWWHCIVVWRDLASPGTPEENQVKTESLSIGLKANAKKTKCQVYNQPEPVQSATLDGTLLEVMNDFRYIGSMTNSTEVNVKCRKAAAWRTCNKLNRLWKSQLNRSIMIRVFCTVVESVLLYGLETWTLTKRLEKQLDGCYTCMLKAVQTIHWSDHISNKDLYGSLPKFSEKLKQQRLRSAGHCYRHSEEAVSRLVLWTPTHGQCDWGWPAITYVDTVMWDTGLTVNEIRLWWRIEMFGKPSACINYWQPN